MLFHYSQHHQSVRGNHLPKLALLGPMNRPVTVVHSWSSIPGRRELIDVRVNEDIRLIVDIDACIVWCYECDVEPFDCAHMDLWDQWLRRSFPPDWVDSRTSPSTLYIIIGSILGFEFPWFGSASPPPPPRRPGLDTRPAAAEGLEGRECIICLEELRPRVDVWTCGHEEGTDGCGATIHADCMRQWTSTGYNCPHCRRDIG